MRILNRLQEEAVVADAFDPKRIVDRACTQGREQRAGAAGPSGEGQERPPLGTRSRPVIQLLATATATRRTNSQQQNVIG